MESSNWKGGILSSNIAPTEASEGKEKWRSVQKGDGNVQQKGIRNKAEKDRDLARRLAGQMKCPNHEMETFERDEQKQSWGSISFPC